MDFSRRARCASCKLPTALCCCALLPRVTLPVRFLFLRHVAERRRQSNTGDLAQRMLANSALLDHGVLGSPLDTAELADSARMRWVLFPIPGAGVLSRERLLEACAELDRHTLILLDAPWRSARRMLTRVPALRGVPVLALPEGPPMSQMLRRPLAPGQLFTLEATVRAVAALGFDHEAAALRDATTLLIGRMLYSRGKISAADAALE